MRVLDKIVVVTGGAKGIGKALCERFHKDGARKIIVADIDIAGAKAVAASIGGEAYACDVTKEADIVHLVTDVEGRIGPIDLFCSNAGVAVAFNPLTENAAIKLTASGTGEPTTGDGDLVVRVLYATVEVSQA